MNNIIEDSANNLADTSLDKLNLKNRTDVKLEGLALKGRVLENPVTPEDKEDSDKPDFNKIKDILKEMT